MSNSQIVYNILQPIIHLSNDNAKPSVFYDTQDSIFDSVVSQQCGLIVYDHQHHLFNTSVDIFWTNNPTHHTTQIDHIKSLHIPDIIYFRAIPPSNLKKEDKFLIQNKFADSTQICRNDAIKKYWGVGSDALLEYGVPKIELVGNPKKDLVILNTSKQKNLYLLQKQIQQYWPGIEIIDDISDLTVNDISNKLQQYKLCIAAEDEYNILFSVASGCLTISNKLIDNCQYLTFDNIEQLVERISVAFKEYQHYDRYLYSQNVIKNYNMDVFSTYIQHYIKEIIRKPVLL